MKILKLKKALDHACDYAQARGMVPGEFMALDLAKALPSGVSLQSVHYIMDGRDRIESWCGPEGTVYRWLDYSPPQWADVARRALCTLGAMAHDISLEDATVVAARTARDITRDTVRAIRSSCGKFIGDWRGETWVKRPLDAWTFRGLENAPLSVSNPYEPASDVPGKQISDVVRYQNRDGVVAESVFLHVTAIVMED